MTLDLAVRVPWVRLEHGLDAAVVGRLVTRGEGPVGERLLLEVRREARPGARSAPRVCFSTWLTCLLPSLHKGPALERSTHEESSLPVPRPRLQDGSEVAAPPLLLLVQSCLAALAFRRNPRRVDAETRQSQPTWRRGARPCPRSEPAGL